MISKKIKLEKIRPNKSQRNKIKKFRKEISEIILGNDQRVLFIVGPCSVYDERGILEYAEKLNILKEKYKDKAFFVLRFYTQKPRTSLGWKGLMHQPDFCSDKIDLKKGLKKIYKLIGKITDMDLALADEALFLNETFFLEDWMSYLAIGARSAEDQMHRNYAATLDFPCGLKNPTGGSFEILKNSILAAGNRNFFYSEGIIKISEKGNQVAHAILRGSEKKPNYYYSDLKKYLEIMSKKFDKAPFIIDTNHGNSGKDHLKQEKVVFSVLSSLKKDEKIKENFKGFMIESYLKDGNQGNFCSTNDYDYALSLTDPCLGWEKTEKLIERIIEKLNL